MLQVGPASCVRETRAQARQGTPTTLLRPHLAQGEQRGDSPEGELQCHQGGHPVPHDGQDQGQSGQVHDVQRSPLGPQPLLFQPPLRVAVGGKWL